MNSIVIRHIHFFHFIVFFSLIIFSEAKGQEEPIYFEVTHPETQVTSFLYGTYHHYPQGWYELPEVVKNDLSTSTILITEAGNERSSKFIAKMDRAMRYKKRQTFLDQLKGQDKKEFEKYLDENIGGSDFAKSNALELKPYFMMTRLFPLRFSDSIMSMEGQLKQLAIDHGLKTTGLEPNEKRHLRYLKKYADKPLILEKDFIDINLQMIALRFSQYLEGNLNPTGRSPSTIDKYAAERNLFWLPQLKELLENRVFIAVGAGHLLGEEALQRMLEDEGFIVKAKPLKLPIPEELQALLAKFQ